MEHYMKPLAQGNKELGYLKTAFLVDVIQQGKKQFILSSNRHVKRLVEWGYLTEEISGIALIYRPTQKAIEYIISLNYIPNHPVWEGIKNWQQAAK